MRSLSLSAFLLLLLSFSLTCLSAAEAGTPEALVAALYKAHDNDKSPFFQTDDKARLNKYFTKELAGLIWKDAKDSEGEVGVLGFDPLYDAQDTEIKNFAVQKPLIDGEKALLLVTFVNFDEKVKITYSLVREEGAWKIADIRYPAGHSLLKLYQEAAAGN